VGLLVDCNHLNSFSSRKSSALARPIIPFFQVGHDLSQFLGGGAPFIVPSLVRRVVAVSFLNASLVENARDGYFRLRWLTNGMVATAQLG